MRVAERWNKVLIPGNLPRGPSLGTKGLWEGEIPVSFPRRSPTEMMRENERRDWGQKKEGREGAERGKGKDRREMLKGTGRQAEGMRESEEETGRGR